MRRLVVLSLLTSVAHRRPGTAGGVEGAVRRVLRAGRAAGRVAGVLMAVAGTIQAQATLRAGPLTMMLDRTGQVSALRSATTGREYLHPGSPAPFLTLVSGGVRHAPTTVTLTHTRAGPVLDVRYAESGVHVRVGVRTEPDYLVFTILTAAPADRVDAVIWGPYPTTVGATVGEIVGVVRDQDVALGLQVLNMKTLGGDLPNREGSTWARGIAARPTAWGSVLNAYAINRARDRVVDGWGGDFPNMPVSALAGETVDGSAIALFAAPARAALEVMERIEVSEHLPHPTIDGTWFRRSPLFERSYMISAFGEGDVDEMIGYAKRAGLYSLYHEGPFSSWGHFVLDTTQWPHGRQGMKAAVAKARAAGLHFGVHTLTNFLNTNDPYVTPVPDDRLAVTGRSVLAANIDAQQSEIEVASPEFFANEKHDNLHTVKIGTELIQFGAVTTAPPYRLLECRRGAFGTHASAHRAGESVGKLLDHAYKVFFPDFAMQREVASNLARFLNETGVDHIDFDGHEGALASGQGDYALSVFTTDVLSQVTHDLINGTSISKTFNWHTGSYYNWGEPWYGGFAESMQQYRIDNQALFDRNFMPHMLGWYLLTETTTLAEMEWMLARAAGYGAGFAMVARPKALRANANTPALLDAIRDWEDARTRHAFDSAQAVRLREPAREFHLERVGDGEWRLRETVTSPVFVRTRAERQPGEPTGTVWRFDQPWESQRLQFRLRVTGSAGSVRTLRMQVDRHAGIELPMALAAGESLVVDGTEVVRVYDATGKPKARFTLGAPLPLLGPGVHVIELDSEFSDEAPVIEVQFKGAGRAEAVRATR